jgi:hypothetical protein
MLAKDNVNDPALVAYYISQYGPAVWEVDHPNVFVPSFAKPFPTVDLDPTRRKPVFRRSMVREALF